MHTCAMSSAPELEFECQVGSKRFPEYPIRSSAEAFYQLRKALGIHDINAQVDIETKSYRASKYVIGIDMERVLGASFSGYNSKSGDLLTIKLRIAWNGADVNTAPSQVHTVLHYDAVLHISDVGAHVLEQMVVIE